MVTITLPIEDALNLINLIRDSYTEAIRERPNKFIDATNGKAVSYYTLLEKMDVALFKAANNTNEKEGAK